MTTDRDDIEPMRTDVPDAELADLQARLRHARLSQPTATGWERGMDGEYLRELIAFWAEDFDWRAQEERLNAYEHALVRAGSQRVHIVRVRSSNPDALPLLLLHGWPGSFVQMLDLADMLTEFDVVIGSLPGFAFSDAPAEPGMNEAAMADIFDRVMVEKLGYATFLVHGSDFGAGVASDLAARHPEHLLGAHLSGTTPRAQGIDDGDSPELQQFAADVRAWRETEVGYGQIQSTKPDTLAIALNDSPAGLAAWIVEKFRRWSDCDGDVERRFTKDQLLTNVMVYWLTGSIGSSIAAYAESASDPDLTRATVPIAHLLSNRDMLHTPREWIERSSRIDQWTQIDRGGHFIEWEEPGLVAADLRMFARSLTAERS